MRQSEAFWDNIVGKFLCRDKIVGQVEAKVLRQSLTAILLESSPWRQKKPGPANQETHPSQRRNRS